MVEYESAHYRTLEGRPQKCICQQIYIANIKYENVSRDVENCFFIGRTESVMTCAISNLPSNEDIKMGKREGEQKGSFFATPKKKRFRIC